MIILTGTFSVGWSKDIVHFRGSTNPPIIESHPDMPHDPFALLLYRYQQYTQHPECIVCTTWVDTIECPIIESIITDLASVLFPMETTEYSHTNLMVNQHEFFYTCIQHAYTKTFYELNTIRTSPVYFQHPNTINHMYVPPYVTDTPDTMYTVLAQQT